MKDTESMPPEKTGRQGSGIVTRRRTLRALAGIGAVSLAGCSGTGDDAEGSIEGDGSDGGDTNSGNGDGGSTESDDGGTTDSGDTSGGGEGSTTIEWWHAMGGQRGQVLEDLVEQFNDQSEDVTVNAVFSGSYYETINATVSAIRAGEAPELVQVLNVASKLAWDSGEFESMESVVGDGIDWDSYHDAIVNYYRWDGEAQALPFNTSNPILYYNKDAFEAAGLDPEDPPATFEGVTEASRALVEEGVTETGLTFKNTSWYVEQWFAAQNQVLVNEENGRAGDADGIFLESDAAFTVYDWVTDLHDEGLFEISGGGEGGGSNDSPIQFFVNGNAGMLIQTTGDAVAIGQAARDNDFELGTGTYPSPNGDPTGLVVGGGGVWVTQGLSSEKKAAVAEFVSWLGESEQQAFWHQNTGYFPVSEESTGILESDNWFENNPSLRLAFDQLRETEDTPATRGFQVGPSAEIRALMQDGLVSMVTGTSVEDVLGERKPEGDQILEQYIQSKG